MDIWITQTALEAEASGYFLVPAGPLPSGWEAVPREIGETVWGKGQTSGPDPDGTGQCDPKAGGYASGDGGATECKGMAQYSFHALLASLNIADVPVGYSPPRGPAINFLVTYNLREARQPATFSYSNLGNKWTFDWLSYVTDEPLNTNANVLYFGRGGGTETFTNLGNGTFSTQIESRTPVAKTLAYDLNGDLVSVTTATSTNTYEWDAADRLLAVNIGTNRSEFTYDGLSRRVRIVEKTQQTQWGEGHSYDNPDVSTPELREWFLEMIREYPPMNGPHASEDVENSKVTDYSVGKAVIYAAFAWSEAEAAFETMFTLARKHRVGFFDVSADDGRVWVPDAAGGYSCVHGQGAGSAGYDRES